MRNTGIVRKIDTLNRFVIPRELCKTFGLEPGTPMEIYTDGDNIILRKYQPTCSVCNESYDLIPSLEKHSIKICRKCLKESI